jgi:hypothetical protein
VPLLRKENGTSSEAHLPNSRTPLKGHTSLFRSQFDDDPSSNKTALRPICPFRYLYDTYLLSKTPMPLSRRAKGPPYLVPHQSEESRKYRLLPFWGESSTTWSLITFRAKTRTKIPLTKLAINRAMYCRNRRRRREAQVHGDTL